MKKSQFKTLSCGEAQVRVGLPISDRAMEYLETEVDEKTKAMKELEVQ